jgi:hypothetical protein
MTNKPLSRHDPMEQIRCFERCRLLQPIQQRALAATCAGKVVCFFKEKMPENSWILEETISACWEIIQGNAVVGYEQKLIQLHDAVPDSETESIGAGLPAGEAVIAAFETAQTGDCCYDAVQAAYTAVHMNEYMKQRRLDDPPQPVPGARLQAFHAMIAQSQPMQDYVDFVDRALSALEQGLAPSLLRSQK